MSGNITGNQQVARITALLGEIEELSREVPAPLLARTLSSIERARGLLKNCERSAGTDHRPAER